MVQHYDGTFVPPTLIEIGAVSDLPGEVFGPVLVMIPYDSEDDAVRIANNSKYGLSGGVLSADDDRALAIGRRIRTGTFSINGGNYFTPDVPFGGYKESGLGREHGREGVLAYTETKSVLVAL